VCWERLQFTRCPLPPAFAKPRAAANLLHFSQLLWHFDGVLILGVEFGGFLLALDGQFPLRLTGVYFDEPVF